MGNSIQTLNINECLPNSSHWLIIPKPRIKNQNKQTNFICLRNRINGKMLDRYDIFFLSQQEQKVYKYYCNQRSISPELVGVAYYIPISNTQFCGNQLKAHLYFQHFPFRLFHIKNLTFLQGIYALNRALQGFKLLYQRIGYFKIKQSLIYLNKHGELKVWVNQDLSKMFPEKQNQKIQNATQQSMIMNIINLIQGKFNQQNGYIKYSEYIKRRNFKLNNFSQTISIFQFYINQFKLNLPSSCKILHNQKNLRNSPIKKKLSKSKDSKDHLQFSLKKQSKFKYKQNKVSLQKRLKSPLLNYSMDQSNAVSLIWQQNLRLKTLKTQFDSVQCPQQQNQRLITLADNLLSQTSCSVSTNKSLTPISKRITNFQTENLVQSHINMRNSHFKRIIEQKSYQIAQRTSQSTPRVQNYNVLPSQKCKFQTIKSSIEIDSLIAQDLVQYL